MLVSVHFLILRKTRAMSPYQEGYPLSYTQQIIVANFFTTSVFYALVTLDTLTKSIEKARQCWDRKELEKQRNYWPLDKTVPIFFRRFHRIWGLQKWWHDFIVFISHANDSSDITWQLVEKACSSYLINYFVIILVFYYKILTTGKQKNLSLSYNMHFEVLVLQQTLI